MPDTRFYLCIAIYFTNNNSFNKVNNYKQTKRKMKDLTEHLQLLLEKAKGDKKCLIALKNASVAGMQFELAAELRDIENKLFPESEEYKKAKKTAEEISLLFRMLEVNSDNGTAWLIYEAITTFNKRKSKFDMKDCANLLAKRQEYFGK